MTESTDRLKQYQEKIKKDLVIDYVNLDDAAIRTPQLFGEYMGYLTDEIIRLSQLEADYKKVYKRRWSYYMGHASEEDYKKEPLRVKVAKQETAKYLDADDVLSEMHLRVEKQKALVKLLEETMKAITSRQFAVRDAISWRVFQAGGR